MHEHNDADNQSNALATLRRIRGGRPKLEVISAQPSAPRDAPPILFVHGAWHGAWCWGEHFLDYFSKNGFAAHAFSLRGHGSSEGKDRLRRVRLRDYVEDVAAVAESLPAPPILVGHSMGGFVVQKYLETRSAPLAILMASLPPGGAWRLMLRCMRKQPLDVIKSNLTVSLWPIISNQNRAHGALFSPEMPSGMVARYHALLQDEAVFAYFDCLFDVVSPGRIAAPIIVMGAGEDKMITPLEVTITAEAYGVEPIIFPDCAHDMMLDLEWRNVADTIIRELELRFSSGHERSRIRTAA